MRVYFRTMISPAFSWLKIHWILSLFSVIYVYFLISLVGAWSTQTKIKAQTLAMEKVTAYYEGTVSRSSKNSTTVFAVFDYKGSKIVKEIGVLEQHSLKTPGYYHVYFERQQLDSKLSAEYESVALRFAISLIIVFELTFVGLILFFKGL